MLLLSLLWLCYVASTLALGSPDYHESLDLVPLPPDELLASFHFRSNSSLDAFNRQNYRFFPRSLGQLLQHANTRELHLRFSTGRWDAERWSERPWHGFKEGATGVELWAWIEADSDEVYVLFRFLRAPITPPANDMKRVCKMDNPYAVLVRTFLCFPELH